MTTNKIDYKALKDVTGDTSVVTPTVLATEFETSNLKISQALSAAGVTPVGKIPRLVDGKPAIGKPTLAFNGVLAREAITKSLAVETKTAA